MFKASRAVTVTLIGVPLTALAGADTVNCVAGPGFTVSVAAVVLLTPVMLVKTARNWLPLCAMVAFERVSVVLVAPPMSANVAPPLVLNCHCTVGAGLPLAAAVKLAFDPAITVWLAGFCVTSGPTLTVSVAAVVVAVPTELVKTARKRWPFCAKAAVKVSVVLVAPAMSA